MLIYLINLDRSVDRLREFETRNASLGPRFIRATAVEGKSADRADLARRGLIAEDLHYGDGALGNAISHIALWTLAIERNETMTVCEGDAIFNSAFVQIAERALGALPSDWHIVMWGWNFDAPISFDAMPGISGCIAQFDQESMRKGIAAFQAATLMPQLFKLFQLFGTICYSITPRGAAAIKQACLPLRNTNIFISGLGRPVPNLDIGIAINAVLPHINAFVSIPPLVLTRNDDSRSTIGTIAERIGMNGAPSRPPQ